ncbi:decarboxylase [Sorangium cellulosum]|uniref:Decarboxylase n=1 Tax=Sorangium cellulosum TaxID=56 RepID=A0A150S426_SORCE|nr:decarboxylase [Sorangium cellulosum]
MSKLHRSAPERGHEDPSGIGRFVNKGQIPRLGGPGTSAPEAWFLGMKAENADEFERLIVEAIRDQAFWRRNFHPDDPTVISEAIKRRPDFVHAMDTLKDSYRSLLALLKKSVPFFSMRYQGHMNWDTAMPAVLGYFAAMLYNPNNVAFEGSTATTLLEILVGDDLCRMLGYAIPDKAAHERGAVRPWGHITSGGTVANIEALWSARNLKLYPVAVQAALREEVALAAAKDFRVSAHGRAKVPLLTLDAWSLMNLEVDEILAIPSRLTAEHGVAPGVLTEAMSRYSPQSLGMHEFFRRFCGALGGPPVILVPATKHYSFPKGAAILGIGAANVIDVPLDEDARMSIPALRKILKACLAERRPVYSVVAVIGSTEESAVDPLADILELRQEMRAAGLDFTVHADAAWGGYHVCVLRDDEGGVEPPGLEAKQASEVGLGRHAVRHYTALSSADSITVDPHKSGYIPYPAGALCYRNGAMRDLVTFKAPYIVHDEAEPAVGIYGLEGSKPGAAVAAVYLAHKVIRPTKRGYGKIHRKSLFNCKRVYARLLCMAKPEDHFVVVPVSRLPAEIAGSSAEEQIQFIRDRIDRKRDEELLADAQAMALLPELGPDVNILCYAFNFKHADGRLNASLDKANRLNKAIYEVLSIKPGEDVASHDLIVSTTDFEQAHYGKAFLDSYKRRLGVGESEGNTITVLRSTVLNPWLTEDEEDSFLDMLEAEFREAISRAMLRDSVGQVFEEIDANKDGRLEWAEIDARLRALGHREEEIARFFRMSDITSDGYLSKSEFLEHFSQFLVHSSLGR